MTTEPKFLPLGDTALTVEFAETIDRATNARVIGLDAGLRDAAIDGVIESVPTFRSLTIHFNPITLDHATLTARVTVLLAHPFDAISMERTWRIPVCYDGDYAPDLSDVAEQSGLDPLAVVERHAQQPYFVYMIGFLPGLPYLGDLPKELDLPRRKNPRVRVPPGSVAIAAGLSTIYPYESPGGWHLIGRTPVSLFSHLQAPPSLLAPGDTVHFEPVDRAEFARLESLEFDQLKSLCLEPEGTA